LKALVFTYRGALVPLALIPALLLPPAASGAWGLPAGIALVALGLFFRIAGVRWIGGQARIHSGGARHLITSGIFARVRNPLYIGNALVVGGGAALFFSLWSVPLVLLYLLTLYTVIVLYEEKCLVEQMKAPFITYLENVPRWIPRLTPYKNPDAPRSDPTPWSVVLRNERWFLACCLTLVAGGLFLLQGDPLLSAIAGDPVPPACRLIASAAVVLVAAALFVRIALRLQRKRGSWLEVERIAASRSGS
jgi:protein-S-isoprenylcysteine O-methyltransferase Ste14